MILSNDKKTLLSVDKNIKTFIVPDSVEIIDFAVFSACENLKSIEAPNVIKIGNCAFQFNIRLEYIIAPKCEEIGIRAFNSCFRLKSIIAPNCEKIGPISLCNCLSIYNIDSKLNADQLINAFNNYKHYNNYILNNREYKLKSLFN